MRLLFIRGFLRGLGKQEVSVPDLLTKRKDPAAFKWGRDGWCMSAVGRRVTEAIGGTEVCPQQPWTGGCVGRLLAVGAASFALWKFL